MKKIDKEVRDCPETVFDTFNLGIDLRKTGAALREELANLSNLYGRISQLASNALLLYEKAKNRRDRVESEAWERVPGNMKVTERKIAVKTIPVTIDGEKTSLNQEEERVILYSYMYQRGKNKMSEISTILDIGRTLLSWDKSEMTTFK